ncbi:MAG TPA: DUF222 domain-containing protein [Actinomycetales bacterium]|jgi:hypothetical protein
MTEHAWQQLAVGSAAVAHAPVWQLSDTELVEALRAEQVAEAQRVAGRLALLRELDVRGCAAGLSFTSTQAWLSHELLIDRTTAAADVRAARQLDPVGDVPRVAGVLVSRLLAGEVALAATGRALVEGSISRAHADAVSTCIRNLPVLQGSSPAEVDELRAAAEAALLAECSRLVPADVRRCGARIRHLVDPDGVLADERDAITHATFWIKPDPDTAGYRFGGTTDAVTGAQLQTLVDAHAKPRPVLNPETRVMEPDPRLPEQRRAHAFAALVRLAANVDDSISGGTSTQLVVTATLESLQGRLSERGIACTDTETGAALSAATTRLLACDTNVIPMILGSNSEPLDVGRSTRTIPTAIRRALVKRDKGCAFPGCRRPPRWADGHHIRHWADGGPTCLDNLVLLCGHHHDVIHHTAWTVRIDNGQPVFTAPASTTTSRARGRPPPPVA